MSAWWPAVGLALIVGLVLLAQRLPMCAPLFRWLPIPLWCYALPMMAVSIGWLPSRDPAYPALINGALPLALGLLLFGVDLASIVRTGPRALLAAGVGALGIILGAVLGTLLLRPWLPADAWKGAGTLTATWTGGTMNLLALRTILDTPESIFAPLIIVDAMIAYSWMALLVAMSGRQGSLNRWLRADAAPSRGRPHTLVVSRSVHHVGSTLACCVLAAGLSWSARAIAVHLPTSSLISSAAGWVALLVTTGGLSLALIPRVRTIGGSGGPLGYYGLYLVLAATGAQASLRALWSAPVWLAFAAMLVLTHALVLVLAGRVWRLPLGLLATASQANIGGVVSAPLVAAVYSQELVPIGLLLAIAGNAVGTYLGLGAATLCHWAMQVIR
ncbi:MAG: DUF819 family protein [Candidatus Omnitrophica bacterium]|nr:DUF819 family protein [Candidatus Omnitrophota bacterium]